MNYLHYFYSIKFLVIIWIVLIYILYVIWDKENKLKFNNKYYDTTPNAYSPAKMKALVNYGKLYPKDLVAEVMFLILNDIFIITKGLNNKIKLTLNKDKDLATLTDDEFLLVNWLLKTVKNDNEIDVRYIIKPSSKLVNTMDLRKNFLLWAKEVNKTLSSQNLFRSKKAPRIFGIILSFLYLLLTLFLTIYFKRLLYLILIILSVITLIYSLNISKRTLDGQKKYALWMAFKRYLRDIEKTEPQLDITKAENYLPYAISLGVHASVIKIIKNNITEENTVSLKIFNTLSLDEFEKLLNKILKSAERSIISDDFK